MPDQYPSPSTCWRRLSLWEEKGVWLDIWRCFLGEMYANEALDWEEQTDKPNLTQIEETALRVRQEIGKMIAQEMIDAQENEFGEERLKQLVVQHASRPAGELAELIIETAATFAQDRGAFDDETLVVIRRQPTRR